jgi:hypothetical protein
MKPRILVVVLVSFLILARLAPPAFAHGELFDGQRKGFVLGGGLGGVYLFWPGYGGDRQNLAFTSNFKVGYAPSNSFEVYFINPLSFYMDDQEPYLIGASCIGVTKYLKPEGKGVFLCGGIGVTSSWLLEAGSPSYLDHPFNGFGAFGGIGYDIGKHWYIQADLLYTNVDYGPRWGFRVTLNTVAF